MDYHLTNKTALVTGSTGGIGLAAAQQLAQEGALVYINGPAQPAVDEAMQQIRKAVPEANLRSAPADFTDPASINALLAAVPAVDILVNNVGTYEPKPFAEITDADWQHYFELNVLSGVRLARHYFPRMLNQNWGRIIFLSSESAIQTQPEMIHYGMTKSAVQAIGRGLAQLTKGTSVTVNTVLPGPTWSEAQAKNLTQRAQEQGISVEQAKADSFQKEHASSLLQRFATTEEVANLITYLASPLAAATNGAPLRVDGGAIQTAW